MKVRRFPLVGLIGIAAGIWFAGSYLRLQNMAVYFIVVIICWLLGELIGVFLGAILGQRTSLRFDNLYWNGFNLLARLFGIFVILIGLGFLSWGLNLIPGHTVSWNDRLAYLIAALFSIVLGLGFLLVKGYYPKK